VLQEHTWKFATVIQPLVAPATTAKTITGITKANPGVVTCANHGLLVGDEVTISSVVGMTELNGRTFIIANVATSSFTLQTSLGADVSTLGYGTYTSGGTATYRISLPGWNYAWVYPNPNSLFVRKVYQDQLASDPQPSEYKIFYDTVGLTQYIATQVTPVYAEFTHYGSALATTNATPLFVEMWAYKIASMVAKPLTGDLNLGEAMLKIYMMLLAKAKLADALEQNVTPNTVQTSKFIDAR
jgi:hypothetical protein